EHLLALQVERGLFSRAGLAALLRLVGPLRAVLRDPGLRLLELSLLARQGLIDAALILKLQCRHLVLGNGSTDVLRRRGPRELVTEVLRLQPVGASVGAGPLVDDLTVGVLTPLDRSLRVRTQAAIDVALHALSVAAAGPVSEDLLRGRTTSLTDLLTEPHLLGLHQCCLPPGLDALQHAFAPALVEGEALASRASRARDAVLIGEGVRVHRLLLAAHVEPHRA